MKASSLLPLIGIFVFVAVVSGLDLNRVAAALLGARPEYILFSAVLTVPVVLAKGMKWRIVIKSYGSDFPLLRATRAWLVGFFLGIISPGRVGDLYRAHLLRREGGIGLGRSLTTVVVDRIIDIAVLFVLGLAGMALILSRFVKTGSAMQLYFSVFFLLFIGAVSVMTRKGLMRSFFGPLSRALVPSRFQGSLGTVFNDFYRGLSQMSGKRISAAFALCAAAWSLNIAQYYLLSVSLGLGLPYLIFVAIAPIVTILDTLPVSFSGIGTREAAMVFLLAHLSVAAESAVSLSLLIFMMNYLLVGFVGILFWIKRPATPDNRAFFG